MYVFYILDSQVKVFMNKILRENTFDDFEMRTFELETFVKFDIKGNLSQELVDEENGKYFACWGQIKNYVFELVKGKTKPKSMKIVISANREMLGKISENGAAMFLNFIFENDKVTCTTGTSQKVFALDKSVDNAWEDYVKKLFIHNGIEIVEENYED